ncbi:MAG: YeeE/YedE family protein [Myxococcales bacterium]|nr:YeeE/YedE family protein [Myxococcales bacterium]
MSLSWSYALAGGALIGSAAVLLFLTHGRIAGISGVVGSLLPPVPSDRGWRFGFVLGLVLAGVVAAALAPAAVGASVRSSTVVLLAGLLVGFGTRMGSGCTSGHGVCGLSRLSPRSMVAVVTFMVTGAITAIVAGGAA